MTKNITDMNDIQPGQEFTLAAQDQFALLAAMLGGQDPETVPFTTIPTETEKDGIFKRSDDGTEGFLTNAADFDEEDDLRMAWDEVVENQNFNIAEGTVKVTLV